MFLDGFFTITLGSRTQEKTGLGLLPPKDPEQQKDPKDEFGPPEKPTKTEQVAYTDFISKMFVKKAEVKEGPKKEEVDELKKKATELATKLSVPGALKPEEREKALNEFSQLSQEIKDKVLETAKAKEEPSKDVRELLGTVAKGHQEAHNALVQSLKSQIDTAAAFGRGVWYGIVGPPEDEDLSDEIAALKGVGTALMTGGAATAGIAALTGVGTPVAAAAGAASLLGWALTDNFAGRLEFIQSQRQSKKEKEEYLEKLQDLYEDKRKKDAEAFLAQTDEYLARKKAAEEEILEMRKKFEEEKLAYEKEKAKFWEELNKKKEMKEEEKKKEEEEDRAWLAFYTQAKSRAEEIKSYLQAASNYYSADQRTSALSVANDAFAKAEELEKFVDQNAEFLQRLGVYEAFKEQARAIKNQVEVMRRLYSGIPANRYARQATTNYVNSTQHFNRVAKSYYAKNPDINIYNKSDRNMLKKTFKIQANNYAVGRLLSNQELMLYSYFPYDVYQPTKLQPETIIKLRLWLMKNKKTPLARIPNYIWNVRSGYNYDSEAVALMKEALDQAKVSWAEVSTLNFKELEAILRARQYMWAAFKRGYFAPYEYELFTRLKELLALNDETVAKIFKFPIPEVESSEVKESV
ncbi:MAG: hypothetical protein QXW39_07365 [Candidatus Bathyarchaeia archaeon]